MSGEEYARALKDTDLVLRSKLSFETYNRGPSSASSSGWRIRNCTRPSQSQWMEHRWRTYPLFENGAATSLRKYSDFHTRLSRSRNQVASDSSNLFPRR